ncbi:hypothetical protein D3C80_1010610 [compost metagenome]
MHDEVLAFVAIDTGYFLVGDVDQACLGVIGHRVPVVSTESTRPYHGGLVLVSHTGSFNRAASGQVDFLGPCDLAELLGREQLAALTIQDIEKTVFRCLHQHLSRFAIDLQGSQSDLLGSGKVPGVARGHLVVPNQVAALRANGQD